MRVTLPLFRTARLALALVGAAQALNPIHEASYDLLPRGKYASTWTGEAGFLYNDRNEDLIHIPLGLAVSATPWLELGAGLKTAWGDGVEDNFRHAVLGAKFQADGATALRMDFLIPVSHGAQDGLELGVHHRIGFSQALYARLTGKLGFLDALVRDHAFTAMELAFYPTLRLFQPLQLELGLIGSSQSRDFDRWFALDLQPGLVVGLGGESCLEVAATFGLAGDQREHLRLKVALVKGF